MSRVRLCWHRLGTGDTRKGPQNLSFEAKSKGYIDWSGPIDSGVRGALEQFLSALTDQYTLGGRTYSLRSLLRRHLDAPLTAFLQSAGVASTPISTWGTPHDLRIDKTLAALVPLMGDDERIRATTDALVGLGYKLSGGRSRTSENPLQSFEYCECCERYTSRYESALIERPYLGRNALVHPTITADLRPPGSHRFCKTCSSQEAYESKSYHKRRYGHERGAIQFSRLVMENHRRRQSDGDGSSNTVILSEEHRAVFNRSWSWTKRTQAKFIASGSRTGISSTMSKIRHLAEREMQQDDLVVDVIRSLLPQNVSLPSWLLDRARDFAQFELATIAHGSKQRLVLSGYGRRGIRRTCIRAIASSDVLPIATREFARLTGKLAITPRNLIELEIPHLNVQFRADIEVQYVDKTGSTQAAARVPPKFQAFVRDMMAADASARGHVRFVCQVERAYQYRWLLDHFRTESQRAQPRKTRTAAPPG